MDFTKSIEKILPNSDGWEWFDGARYRLKHVEGDYWYGIRVINQNDQIEAQTIVVAMGTKIKVIKSHREAFGPLDSVLEDLDTVKKEAEICADSKRPYVQ